MRLSRHAGPKALSYSKSPSARVRRTFVLPRTCFFGLTAPDRRVCARPRSRKNRRGDRTPRRCFFAVSRRLCGYALSGILSYPEFFSDPDSLSELFLIGKRPSQPR